jgi:hypothetical protein
MKKVKVAIPYVFTHKFEFKNRKNFWTKNAEISKINRIFLKFLQIQK